MSSVAGAQFPTTRVRTVVWVRRTSAILSLIGSLLIIFMVTRRKLKKNGSPLRTYHRLLFGTSIADAIASACAIVGPIAAWDFLPIEGTKGNVQTCNAQAFLWQWFFLSTACYNGFLILYFTLATVSKLKESEIERRVEPFMHAVAWFFPLATAITALVLNLYTPALFGLWGCWIGEWPPSCRQNRDTCVIGEHSDAFYMAFILVPLYCLIACMYICLTIIYCAAHRKARSTIRQSQVSLQQQASSRRRSSLSLTNNAVASMKLLQKMKRQALVYATIFLFTYVFLVVTNTMSWFDKVGGRGKNWFPLTILVSMSTVGQGICNFGVFIRPRYSRLRKTNRNKSRLWALWHAVAMDQIDNVGTSSESTLR